MSKFIDETRPEALTVFSTYDRRTRLINPGWNEVSHIKASHDHYAGNPDTGMLVGSFAALRETHYVARDADDSPFTIHPETAVAFVLPREGAAPGEFTVPEPVVEEPRILDRGTLNFLARERIESYYPLGKQLSIARYGTDEQRAEMDAYIRAVLEVTNAYEGRPSPELPWPAPPASRKDKKVVVNPDWNGVPSPVGSARLG